MDDFVTWLERQLVDAAGHTHPRRGLPVVRRSLRPTPGGVLALGGVVVALAVGAVALTLPSRTSHAGSAAHKPQTSSPLGSRQEIIRELDDAHGIAGWRAVPADVTGYLFPCCTPRSVPRRGNGLLLDVGSAAGVRTNDPVIAAGAFVGRVSRIGSKRKFATVTLISAPGSSVAAQVRNLGGDKGSLVGTGLVPTHLELEDLPAVTRFDPGPLPGQQVVTLGIWNGGRDVQPAGIPIGQVSNTTARLRNHQRVVVSPAVDLRHLTRVEILTNPPAGSSATGSPPANQLALLGVLRRPPGDLDLIYDQEALSQLFGGVSGIERGYVRLLYHSDRYGSVLLISAKRSSIGSYTFTNPLCLEWLPPSGRGSGGNCQPTSDLTSGHLGGSYGMLEYIVVPDSVATVMAHFSDGSIKKIVVHNNVVVFTQTRLTRPGGAPELPTSTQWLDAAGKTVPQSP